MRKFFEDLKAGLEEAIEYKKGKIELHSEVIEIPEPATTGSKSYEEILFKNLKNDPQEAIGYLRACLADYEEPEVFLLALQDVAEAYDGVFPEELSNEIARLYYIVAANGGERFDLMQRIFDEYGILLSDDAQSLKILTYRK